jgi:hypothetical protein
MLVVVIQNRPSGFWKWHGIKSYAIKINGETICGEIGKDSIQTLLISL